jgi:hypothetical protein
MFMAEPSFHHAYLSVWGMMRPAVVKVESIRAKEERSLKRRVKRIPPAKIEQQGKEDLGQERFIRCPRCVPAR